MKHRAGMEPVLVLGGGLTGLGVVRTLGRRGIPVYVAVERKDETLLSRYCNETFVAHGMNHDPRILKSLLRWTEARQDKRLVVYPTSDLTALMLSQIREEELPGNYRFVVGSKESVETLVNKSRFYKALDRNHIQHPDTFFPQDQEDARRIASRVTYPIFVRPSITEMFVEKTGVKEKGLIAHSPKELISCYRFVTACGVDVMFQDIITGPPTNSYQLDGYYNKDHEPTVLFARQRLRIWPLDFGNSTLCTSIPLAKLAEERDVLDKFIKAIGYHGLLSAEYKKDNRDGTLKLLEINARAWTHCWHSASCGADILFSSYLDAIGEKSEGIETYETGAKSTFLLADIRAAATMLLRGNLGAKDWALSLRGIKEFGFFSTDDPFPFVNYCAGESLKLLKSVLIRPCVSR